MTRYNGRVLVLTQLNYIMDVWVLNFIVTPGQTAERIWPQESVYNTTNDTVYYSD